MEYIYNDAEELYYGPIQDMVEIDWTRVKNYNQFKYILKKHHVDFTDKAGRKCWGYILDSKKASRGW